MKTIMAKTPYDSSFSSSNRNFNNTQQQQQQHNDKDKQSSAPEKKEGEATCLENAAATKKKHAATVAILRLRSLLTTFSKTRFHLPSSSSGLGSRVSGTLFGYRRGHVHLAFQSDRKVSPTLLVELATPMSGLVREMASGLVRIALECDKKAEKRGGVKLLDETLWRTYCNGRKCGFAMKRECRSDEWKVLRAVEPISMGAGVLPGNGAEDEVMYMRGRFERVVGSRDSEAFYMMNPEPGSGGPELSIYLLRI